MKKWIQIFVIGAALAIPTVALAAHAAGADDCGCPFCP